MLPDFEDGLLPAGIHEATWDVIVAMLGFNERRRWLIEGLYRALLSLRDAGCERVYLDGSFVTDKDLPGDYDVCWDLPNPLDQARFDPVLLDIDFPRAGQHIKYRGDILPNVTEGNSGKPFVDFFQVDKVSGGAKGIISIDLRGLK
jgi:hypothetical protein